MRKLFITLEMHTVLSGIIQVGREPDIFKKNFLVLFFFFNTNVLSSLGVKHTLKRSILPEYGPANWSSYSDRKVNGFLYPSQKICEGFLLCLLLQRLCLLQLLLFFFFFSFFQYALLIFSLTAAYFQHASPLMIIYFPPKLSNILSHITLCSSSSESFTLSCSWVFNCTALREVHCVQRCMHQAKVMLRYPFFHPTDSI